MGADSSPEFTADRRGRRSARRAPVAGTLQLDVAMQSGMVANQVRIYALGTESAGRVKTAYMTGAYLAGGIGSWLGTRAYTMFG
jgi:hypothetical protein